ncbi:MAG: hypothetical protein ACRETE_08270, partial [Stenotrophobium sp.]
MSLLLCPAIHAQAPDVTQVQTQGDAPLLIDGHPTFPIGFMSGPPAGAITPGGQNAMAVLEREGYTYQLWYCRPHEWGPRKEAELDELLRDANREGMHVAISIADLAHIKRGDDAAAAELKRVVLKYRNQPSLLFYEGVDEPQWG